MKKLILLLLVVSSFAFSQTFPIKNFEKSMVYTFSKDTLKATGGDSLLQGFTVPFNQYLRSFQVTAHKTDTVIFRLYDFTAAALVDTIYSTSSLTAKTFTGQKTGQQTKLFSGHVYGIWATVTKAMGVYSMSLFTTW